MVKDNELLIVNSYRPCQHNCNRNVSIGYCRLQLVSVDSKAFCMLKLADYLEERQQTYIFSIKLNENSVTMITLICWQW